MLTGAGRAADAGGRLITFTSSTDGAHGVYVVDVDTGRVRRLAADTGTPVGATWSPDGKLIALDGIGLQGSTSSRSTGPEYGG